MPPSSSQSYRPTPALDPSTFGDASLLPADMPLTEISSIGDTFGPEFAAAVSAAPAGAWIGPVELSFGVHLVRVSQHKSGRVPTLAEVRDLVVREFANERREAIEKERLEALLKRYRVVIDAPEASTGP